MLAAYLEQLSEKERVALDVARRTFGASFDVERTIGYLEYQKRISLAVNLAR
jgi:hypothetical protein